LIVRYLRGIAVKNYLTWKKSDIESLTINYTSGLRIKTIAHLMGRTPSSINRALDRLKIRQRKSTSSNDNKSCTPRLQPKRHYHREAAPKVASELEVTIQTIIKWGQNHYESLIIQDIDNGLFIVNGVPKHAGQLVLDCNRHRLEANLPLYFVHGVCS
jgi:hypothetical protein